MLHFFIVAASDLGVLHFPSFLIGVAAAPTLAAAARATVL
jgi:hypothetical protein